MRSSLTSPQPMSDLPLPNKLFNALQQAAYQLISWTDQIFQQIDRQQA